MVVAATGFFDGVHLGHQAVLSLLCTQAQADRSKCMVITFWPHPRAVLQSDAVKFRLLNSLEEKQVLLQRFGVDKVHVLSFTRDFSQMSTRQFFIDCLQSQYGVTHLIVGYDHKIGHDTGQGFARLEAVSKEVGMGLTRVRETLCDGKVVSSTKIREAIASGNLTQANRWLGYAYSLQGVVVEGNRLGRSIGFPTANMRLYEPLKQLPDDGVYAVKAEHMGQSYQGMMNIGFRPTVGNSRERTIETNIFEFEEDIYGLPLKISPLFRLRGEKNFVSMAELQKQLMYDKEVCLEWFKNNIKI